jgi:MFS family permease
VPVGRLADRRGPREVYRFTLVLQAAAMASMVLVHSFWLFVLAVCLTELAGSASQAARGPLVRGFAGERPARYRAYLRAAVNLAGSLGALLAALVIQLDTRAAYVCLVLGNAVSFLATAAIVSRLPSLPPVPVPPGTKGRWIALKDRPYLVLTALDGLMSLQGDVQLFALPLWIVGHTHAPRYLVGATALVGTAMVVALQVRASRGVDDSAGAARAWRRSGWAFLVGMGLIAVTGTLPGLPAALLILVGIAVHTVGEILQSVGSFELRYHLAPAHAQGEYTGVFAFGRGLAGVAAPSLLGLLCVSWGAPGWFLLGGVFVLVSQAVPFVVRWADRRLAAPTAEPALVPVG